MGESQCQRMPFTRFALPVKVSIGAEKGASIGVEKWATPSGKIGAHLSDFFSASFQFGCLLTQAITVITRLDDLTVVRQTIQQCCRHLGVMEYL